MEQNEFSRVHEMSERELMAWNFIFAEMIVIEERLLNLEAGNAPGRRPPDARLLAAQEAIKAEIDRRTLAKGAS